MRQKIKDHYEAITQLMKDARAEAKQAVIDSFDYELIQKDPEAFKEILKKNVSTVLAEKIKKSMELAAQKAKEVNSWR